MTSVTQNSKFTHIQSSGTAGPFGVSRVPRDPLTQQNNSPFLSTVLSVNTDSLTAGSDVTLITLANDACRVLYSSILIPDGGDEKYTLMAGASALLTDQQESATANNDLDLSGAGDLIDITLNVDALPAQNKLLRIKLVVLCP
jgi:hypothetical protein